MLFDNCRHTSISAKSNHCIGGRPSYNYDDSRVGQRAGNVYVVNRNTHKVRLLRVESSPRLELDEPCDALEQDRISGERKERGYSREPPLPDTLHLPREGQGVIVERKHWERGH